MVIGIETDRGPWVQALLAAGYLVCDTSARRGDLDRFRQEFYTSLTARADALFELTDALLCADGPVRSLVDLDDGGRASPRARRNV